jgi:hypothetical protein
MIEVDEDILFYAFRYGLGRRSYAVSAIAGALIKAESKLAWITKEQMADEIREAHAKDNLGGDCDKELWLYVRNLYTPSRRFTVEANLFQSDEWVTVEAVLGDDGKYYSLDAPNKWYHTTRNEVPTSLSTMSHG